MRSATWFGVALVATFSTAKGAASATGTAPKAQRESETSPQSRRPNIIIFLADNLGYEDVSWMRKQSTSTTTANSTATKATLTPNIDSIGANGMTMLHWNSAAHLCSASRAALLTGVYPIRTGIYPGVFHPDAALGLLPLLSTATSSTSQSRKKSSTASKPSAATTDNRFPTLATLLKERGNYSTMMVGKWHLGHLPPYLPTRHGFDAYFGIPYHMSGGSVDNHTCAYDVKLRKQWLPLYRNEQIVEQPVDVSTLSARYVQAATDFIRQHHASSQNDNAQRPIQQPFFLYMAFSHVHQLCAAATGREQGTCQWSLSSSSNSTSTFDDAVTEMDDMVGHILSTLRENLDMHNDTIVLFTSDNGPWLAEQACAGLAGPFTATWFRENVPLECTACPHDYVHRPTVDRPRRCQMWQPPSFQHESSIKDATDSTTDNGNDSNDIFTVDGVHCGVDTGLGSVWEANLRMPALVSWPNRIVANTSSSRTVSSLDVVPTLLSLAGLGHESSCDFKDPHIKSHNKRPDDDDIKWDGVDISDIILGHSDHVDHEHNDTRVLFFWRDGFLLDLAPLGPPYGRFDVVAVKMGRYKAWYWTKSAHYNADVEQCHDPPLLFDVLDDPAEANPIVYNVSNVNDFYAGLVVQMEQLVQEHKHDVYSSSSTYPLTLHRDARFIPCANAAMGCRTNLDATTAAATTSGNVLGSGTKDDRTDQAWQ